MMLLFVSGTPGDARAAFFGLFGDDEEQAAPNAESLPYGVAFDAGGADLTGAMRDASDLWRLRKDAPPNGNSLARRTAADLPNLLDALWAEGFYGASVRAVVAGEAIAASGAGVERAAAAADRLRGNQVVPVRIEATLGAPYALRTLKILDARSKAPLPPDLLRLPRRSTREGDQARSGSVRALEAQIVESLRAVSHPLAKVVEINPFVMHRDRAVDVTILVDPGPKAGIGRIEVTGPQTFDPQVVRSYIYLGEGAPLTPERLAALRKSLGEVEIIGSVKILEADKLDASGNLPLAVAVGERKPHIVSVAAQYSTVDGPSVKSSWTDRNLFGAAERLRLDATVGVATVNGGNPGVTRLLDPNRLTGRVGASFLKPALWGTRNDFLADAYLSREVTKTYASTLGNVSNAIRHRFDETFYVQGGFEFERGRSSDVFATLDYTLMGATFSARYDTTDNLFDPTRGVRVIASASAFTRALGSSIDLYTAKTQASAYYALDEDARTVIAGRVALGTLSGAATALIPDNRRFFAGGGGSVRGFATKSLSPLGPGNIPIGGRSLFEASLEGRVKITDTIGIVPFIDAGGAFARSYPDFNTNLRYAAGLGLRYYTGFGPLRLDVATPLGRRKGEAPVAVYISVGQAF